MLLPQVGSHKKPWEKKGVPRTNKSWGEAKKRYTHSAAKNFVQLKRRTDRLPWAEGPQIRVVPEGGGSSIVPERFTKPIARGYKFPGEW